VTNKLSSLFIEENLRVRQAQAEGTSEFLESELQRVKVQLAAQENALRTFKERYMGELPSQLEANLRTLDRLQAERQRLQDSLKNAEERYGLLKQQIGNQATDTDRSPASLSLRLEALRARLVNLRTEYKDEYPDVVLLRKEIAGLEAELVAQSRASGPPPADTSAAEDTGVFQASEQARQMRAIRLRQQEIGNQIREYERRVERTPLREQQLTDVLRDYENTKKNYQVLLDKRQEARIAESLERRQKGEIFRVLDPANFPDRPYRPNRRLLLLIGLLLGMGAGVGMVLVREHLDGSIKSEQELAALTAGLPLLATVPYIVPGRPRKGKRGVVVPMKGEKASP
jgi:polysaccharide chain length determinant protein (PEP-CTERM system associated)